MNEDKKRALFTDIRRRIVKGLDPQSIYIFGSYARGDETENSDIDILVEKQTDLDMAKRTSLARRQLNGFDGSIDILVYTPDELRERMKDRYSVVHRAVNEGIKIYEK